MHKKVRLAKETIDAVMRAELDTSSLQQMKELSTKKDETKLQFSVAAEKQKAGKAGLRIIGIMRDINNMNARPVGYILFNDAKKQSMAYSTEQMQMIMGSYPIVNATLNGDKIVILDGAETAMLQFDAFRNPIGAPTIYVLKRETENVGGRSQEKITFIDNSLTVRQLLSDVIIREKNTGRLTIANMKVSPTPNSGWVLEAKNVDTIPTVEKDIKAAKVATDDAEAYRKQQLKIKNHASFVQRIVDYIESCILVQNSKYPSRYTMHLKVGGLSYMSRGFGYVGTKGLTAIMEKEVTPLLAQRYNVNFADAIREVHSDVYQDGTRIQIPQSFFVGEYVKLANINDPVRLLFLRYLYSFRLVNGLYKTVNTYDIVKTYNQQDGCSGQPYIVRCDWQLKKVYKNMYEHKEKYSYRMALYSDYMAVRARFWTTTRKGLTNIVGGGLSSSSAAYIMWPMPFDACDKAVQILSDINNISGMPNCEKMLIHICSEAALISKMSSPTEITYRRNRVLCMTTALMAIYALNLSETKFVMCGTKIENLIGSCWSEIAQYPLFSYAAYNAVHIYERHIKRVKHGDWNHTYNMLLDYVNGAGLFIPYYSPITKKADSSYMHWHPIFSGIQKHCCVKTAQSQFAIKQIKKKHKYGALWMLDMIIRKLCKKNMEYAVSPNSKYFERLKQHRAERKSNGQKRYTVLTSVENRAAIAQYLGRPYRANAAWYDTNLTRLVYYVNTVSPKLKNKTHELY